MATPTPVPSPTSNPNQPTPVPSGTGGSTQTVNHTPANPVERKTPGEAKPVYVVGKFANYPESGDGNYGAGVGKIVAVDEETDTITVEVNTYVTNRTQNCNFKASDLTPV